MSQPKQLFITHAAGEQIELREIFRKLWRRKWAIIGTIILLTGLTAVALTQVKRQYTAETLVLIDARETNVTDMESVLTGLSADTETILSEIQVIKSRRLIDKLVGRLELDRNPEFNARLRPKGLMARAKDLEFVKSIMASPPVEWLKSLRGKTEKLALTLKEKEQRERSHVVNAILARLQVSTLDRSRVIAISFTSESPRIAAETANELANLYIVEQLEAKFEATQRATTWLNERVGSLRDKVRIAESAVEMFRSKTGLLEDEGGTLTSQQTAELNIQLILARTARAEADARYRQVQKLLGSSDGVVSAAEVLQSPLIQKLRESEAELERRVAELSSEYGAKHPTMINARAELADARKKITIEVNKVVKGLENEVGVARAREASLSGSLENLKTQMATSNTAQIQLRELEREAEANRSLLQILLARVKETTAQEDLNTQQPDARIISAADPPEYPSFPKTKLTLAMAIAGSAIVGLFLAVVLEQLDYGFRSGEQIEHVTGAPVLGLIPILTGTTSEPQDYIVDKPTSAFGESIRTLYTSILLSGVKGPIKRVLITSSQANEGKSTTATCLGRTVALAGKRVMLIDTDLRQPSIHEELGLPQKPGLVELLAGEVQIDEVIHRDEATGLDVICAGRSTPNAPNLLSSEPMAILLDALERKYDLLVFDSPPVMAVADPIILAGKADLTVFVVRWAKTRRAVVVAALKQISKSGGRVAGALLSMVDVKKHARYGFGDSGYYHGNVGGYYSN